MTSTKDENEDENEDERRKRRSKKRTVERRKLIFKTKCVSSQNHRSKKRRGRHGRLSAILSPTFSQRADATVVRRP